MVLRIEPLGIAGAAGAGAGVAVLIVAFRSGLGASVFAGDWGISAAATFAASVPPGTTTLSFLSGSSTFKETTRSPTIRPRSPRSTHYSTLPISVIQPSPSAWETVVYRVQAARDCAPWNAPRLWRSGRGESNGIVSLFVFFPPDGVWSSDPHTG